MVIGLIGKTHLAEQIWGSFFVLGETKHVSRGNYALCLNLIHVAEVTYESISLNGFFCPEQALFPADIVFINYTALQLFGEEYNIRASLLYSVSSRTKSCWKTETLLQLKVVLIRLRQHKALTHASHWNAMRPAPLPLSERCTWMRKLMSAAPELNKRNPQ
jgi:hypothetical protein